MAIITRDNIRLPYRGRIHVGTLVWNTENRSLVFVNPRTRGTAFPLTAPGAGLGPNEVRLLDAWPQNSHESVTPQAAGALSALRTLGVIASGFRNEDSDAVSSVVELHADLGAAAQAASRRTASVTLFKTSGKYYTIEEWRAPVNAIGPYDMALSPDFRRISGGAVLVDTDAASEFPTAENWGVPHLFPSESE